MRWLLALVAPRELWRRAESWSGLQCLALGFGFAVLELAAVLTSVAAGISEPYSDDAHYLWVEGPRAFLASFGLLFGFGAVLAIPMVLIDSFQPYLKTIRGCLIGHVPLGAPIATWSFCQFCAATQSEDFGLLEPSEWMSSPVYAVFGSGWWWVLFFFLWLCFCVWGTMHLNCNSLPEAGFR